MPATAPNYKDYEKLFAQAQSRDFTPMRVNWAINWPKVRTLPGVKAWFGKFINRPAVFAGAGPGLERALPILAALRDRFIIIAADAAMRRMIAGGVRPHITVACDRSPRVADYFSEYQPGDLVAALPFISPLAMNIFRVADLAPFTELCNEEHETGKNFWLPVRKKYLGGDPDYFGRLAAIGTVAAAGIDLAAVMKCSPIALVGMDLSFEEGGERGETNLLECTDVNGAARLTCINFHAYKLGLEKYFGDIGGAGRVVNATGAGILHVNCTLDTPEASLPKYAGEKQNYSWLLRKELK